MGKNLIAGLPDFDLAEHLKSEEGAYYLTMVMAEGGASELAHALGIAAKVRGNE
jgi:DNA-binding phage protein